MDKEKDEENVAEMNEERNESGEEKEDKNEYDF